MKTEFWAKTTSDGQPGVSVFEHMVNVGYVAQFLTEASHSSIKHFGLNLAQIIALAALHDLGKISPGFQRKCEPWLRKNGLLEIDRNWVWDTNMESNHGKVTHAALQSFLTQNQTTRKTAKFLSAVLGGHHGRLSPPNDRGLNPPQIKQIVENCSGIDWEKERGNAAEEICKLFDANFSRFAINDTSPLLWWLAGLTTVADWIGSNELFFPAEGGVSSEIVAETAKKSVAGIGCIPPEMVAGLSFQDLFDFSANEIQTKAISTITGPGVFVIEAPMGIGKTEAALGAAYQLLLMKKAQGIYFALPTQATSNRIHLRIAEFIRRISPKAVESQLIHGNSWLRNKTLELTLAETGKYAFSEDARVGRDWFVSAKRALLAPFGVGTVDQALLGVVAAKHFFVRQYALAGKVVIIDEVHSYDLYTGTLIGCLIQTLKGLGCTVIVLSATLSGKQREKIVSSRANDDYPAKKPYPLITGQQAGKLLPQVATEPLTDRNLDIIFESEEQAVADALIIAEKGGCVLWITNTVKAAQKQFQIFQKMVDSRFLIGLLHSRFPFWRREELENEWMERLGKVGNTRCGSILISTQIVEQSVDLDADLLITELAPTDMLLQRTGRLWRHGRSSRPCSSRRIIILEEPYSLDEFRKMAPQAIRDALGGKAYVYDPYVLLRSLDVWKRQNQVAIPSQIRGLIEATYEVQDNEPEAWQKLFEDSYGKSLAHKQKALQSSNIWTVLLNDEEGVQTRLNELPTISLLLCHKFSKTVIEFIDGTSGILGGDNFHLATAQAIHRNIVKTPEHHFEKIEASSVIAKYLRGAHSIGLVRDGGYISVTGLKSGIRFRWSMDLGLVVEK